MIPAEAVEAAKRVALKRYASKPDTAYLRTILEAAAPHMHATLTSEVAYQKSRAAYFKYAPEIEHDPEGVKLLADEMREARRAYFELSGTDA